MIFEEQTFNHVVTVSLAMQGRRKLCRGGAAIGRNDRGRAVADCVSA